MRFSPLKRLAASLGAIVIALAAAAAADAGGFVVTPLVSNNGVPGTVTDPNLVNARGLVAGPMTPWWVADNGSNLSTLYTGAGVPVSLVVKVGDAPTGLVFSSTTGFNLPTGGLARFLFDSEAGVISGWNGGTNAQTFRDLSKTGAVFKGLAIASTGAGPRLFATDFRHSKDRRLRRLGHAAVGALLRVQRLPELPRNFAPFGIQAIGSRIYVTYAERQMPGATTRRMVRASGSSMPTTPRPGSSSRGSRPAGRSTHRGARARAAELRRALPATCSSATSVTVGSTRSTSPQGGSSSIPGRSAGRHSGEPITIDGLWSLQFGNGFAAGPTSSLFFTAGPDDESDGLFGSIIAAP